MSPRGYNQATNWRSFVNCAWLWYAWRHADHRTENHDVVQFLRDGQEGYLYVDKTAYLYHLVTGSDMYFLSHPRRFGKTLTVSTLEAIFQGRRELFKGLAIDSLDYDWKTCPIIHIDFGNCGRNTAEDLEAWLKKAMRQVAASYGIAVPDLSQHADDVFSDLIDGLSCLGKVVVLIDEYDKVLSDNAFSPQVEKLRQVLGNFYQVVKTKGALLRFVFITGVTRYAMVNEFSGLNNLNNISMDPDYATMLGYTQEELEGNFAGYIEQGIKDTGMGREAYLAKVREMYDGYRFAPGCETVYNPVSVGNFFNPEDGGGVRFNDYWIETGSSRLVMDMAGSVDLDVTEDLGMGMDADGGLRVGAVPSGEEGAGLRAGGGRGDAVVREDGTGHTVQDWKEEVPA